MAEKQVGAVRKIVWAVVLVALVWVGTRFMFGGQSLRGAIAGPQTVADEQIVLTEGAVKAYSFTVPSQRKIEIAVSAKSEGRQRDHDGREVLQRI